MERESQARLLTGMGILAGLVALFFFWKKRDGHPLLPHRGVITVLGNGSDVSYSPETFSGVSRGDTVIWRLHNESARPVEVCVKKFRNETTGGDEDPLEDLGKEAGKCRSLHGGGQGTIPTR